MKKCWPWQHLYKLNLDATDTYNYSALHTFGTKVYDCVKCGKRKMVYPPDCF